MASKAAILLALNLIFFTVVSSTYVPIHNNQPTCPRDALKLGVCADILGLVKGRLGAPPYKPCCSLLDGLIDLEAAVCLCTAIKVKVLGIVVNIPINLSLILNNCGKTLPKGFVCA